MASSSSTSNLSLGGAVVTTGLLAGVYYGFSAAVMPGLREADDATFVSTMQGINTAIVNPAFMVAFLGAPALTAAAAWQQRDSDRPAVRRLLIAALALNLAGLGLTAGANIPLNDALDRVGDPAKLAPTQLAEARAAYEQPWTRRHLLRTGVTVAAFGCLAAAGLATRSERRRSEAPERSSDQAISNQPGAGPSAAASSPVRAASAR